MPTNVLHQVNKRIDTATRKREHHLRRAAAYDERVELLQQLRDTYVPPTTPRKSKEIPAHFRRDDGRPANMKLEPVQIPEAISLLDAGFTWKQTANKLGIAGATLRERVYRYLIEQDMLTVDIVNSIWRDTSYKHLADNFGPPAAA